MSASGPVVLAIALLVMPAVTQDTGTPSEAEIARFVEPGTRELTRASADLNRDGSLDVVLVLERQRAHPTDPEIVERRRPLLILTRQADGSLKREKRNDTLVCSTCEDAGDAIAAGPGTFTVTHAGLGITRRKVQFAFGYSRSDKTWQLVRVEEKVMEDPDTDTMKTTDVWVPPKHFGKIDVADVDASNWKGQGQGYQGLATPVAPIRKLVADVRALPGMGGDLEPPLQEALDSLDDLDRKSNVEAVDALRGFIATLEAGGTQRGPQIPRAEADRLAAGAEKVILQLGSPPAAPATKTYRSERHAVEFRHPGRWLVGDCPDRAACLAVYRRQADLGTDRYLAALEFVALGLEKAVERAGFQKQGGGWVLPGRFGDSRAEEISGSGWKGIQVTQACPVSDGWTGFHAAGGDCLTAVLSSRGRAVLIDTPGDPPTGAELFALIRSVSFLEAGK